MKIDNRKIKTGDTVLIKDSKIKATVESMEVIKGTWVFKLKGWPGKIIEDLIEPISTK